MVDIILKPWSTINLVPTFDYAVSVVFYEWDRLDFETPANDWKAINNFRYYKSTDFELIGHICQ